MQPANVPYPRVKEPETLLARDVAVSPPLPAVPVALDRDQRVVLHDIPWPQYDALCAARENVSGPRMAYLDGTLEIMSPSSRHESDKTIIARLLETYAEERDVSLNGFGSTTYRRKVKEAGVEPDECYTLGPAEKRIPDLAVEVLHTSGGVDKLEIYRRLKVPEVWFWARSRFWIYRLEARRYVAAEQSEVLPGLDLVELARIVADASPSAQTETVRAYRKSLRKKR